MVTFDFILFKNNFFDFLTNPVLLCAILSWLTAQFLKPLTAWKHKERFSVLRLLVGSGGMPSSHAAVVCATAVSCGIIYGYDSAYFAISAILAIVVMRDAAGIRREAGKQAEVLNQISGELHKKRKNFKEVTLSELLGHTPLQVFFGALLGFIMAYLCQRWLFIKIL